MKQLSAVNKIQEENTMKIMEKIYEAYIAGDLDIKLKKQSAEEREAVKKFITECELTEEQALDLEELLLDTIDRRGKEMFFAGFRLAAEFEKELSTNPKKDNKQ